MTSLTDELVDGTPVKIGRTVYQIPPLPFKKLMQLAPQIAVMNAMARDAGSLTDEQFGALVDIAHTAIRRNYPNVAREAIEDELDPVNIGKLTPAIMGLVGLGEAKPGQ